MPSADYGPNHVAAERFLDALDHLGTPEVVTLGAAGSGDFGDGEVEAREALRAELRGTAERAGRLGAIRAMSDEVQRWATSVRHWLPAGVAGTPDARGDMTARMSAVRAVLDAAYGVILEDLLEPEDAELLLRPWRDTVGDPFGREAPPDWDLVGPLEGEPTPDAQGPAPDGATDADFVASDERDQGPSA